MSVFDLEIYTVNPTTTHQEYFELLDASNSLNYSFSDTSSYLGSHSDHTVSKLSADAGSLWYKVKQTSRPQVILKALPPIFLDYKARNRPQL